jgi:transposase InsO family protein
MGNVVTVGHDLAKNVFQVHGVASDESVLVRRKLRRTDVLRFNSKLRAECLNAHWFLTLADAREKVETWRRDYNEVRPHSAIGYKVPSALHNPGGATSPSP